jgi:two-component system chemotaxis sensor kinase CheA
MELEKLLENKSVLIVDDDPRNTFALSSYLEYTGMRILTAQSGQGALDLLQTHTDIQVILMDMMMPEMDGYEAMQKIKSNQATRAIPIIAVTAKAMLGDREKCLEAGADDYVSKPVKMAELLEKMARALKLTGNE